MGARVLRRTLSWLRPVGRATRRAAEDVITAVALFGGLAMVAFGVGMVHEPAGVITGGVELATLAVLYARNRS